MTDPARCAVGDRDPCVGAQAACEHLGMASRRQLIDRAFPDEDVQGWRDRMWLWGLAAFVVAAAGAWPIALLLLLPAARLGVRYVRQQLALGALMAAERRARADAERIPRVDARAHRPLL